MVWVPSFRTYSSCIRISESKRTTGLPIYITSKKGKTLFELKSMIVEIDLVLKTSTVIISSIWRVVSMKHRIQLLKSWMKIIKLLWIGLSWISSKSIISKSSCWFSKSKIRKVIIRKILKVWSKSTRSKGKIRKKIKNIFKILLRPFSINNIEKRIYK